MPRVYENGKVIEHRFGDRSTLRDNTQARTMEYHLYHLRSSSNSLAIAAKTSATTGYGGTHRKNDTESLASIREALYKLNASMSRAHKRGDKAEVERLNNKREILRNVAADMAERMAKDWNASMSK